MVVALASFTDYGLRYSAFCARAITTSTLTLNHEQDSLSFDGYSTIYNWHSDV